MTRLRIDRNAFTLLELLMVILLIAILAAVGMTAFVDYNRDAKNAATKANLQILRNGIAASFGMLQLHCGDVNRTWPTVGTINANDLTATNTGPDTPPGTCQATDLVDYNDRQITGGTGIPVNPWGSSTGGPISTVYDCTAVAGSAGYNPGPASGTCVVGNNLNCKSGAAYGAVLNNDDGWCYDPTTGRIWANSRNNPTTNENSY